MLSGEVPAVPGGQSRELVPGVLQAGGDGASSAVGGAEEGEQGALVDPVPGVDHAGQSGQGGGPSSSSMIA